MAWHWLLQNWLRGLAEEKIREAVAEAARQRASATTAGTESPETQACDVGVVFALAEELGGDLELAIKRLAETKYK